MHLYQLLLGQRMQQLEEEGRTEACQSIEPPSIRVKDPVATIDLESGETLPTQWQLFMPQCLQFTSSQPSRGESTPIEFSSTDSTAIGVERIVATAELRP